MCQLLDVLFSIKFVYCDLFIYVGLSRSIYVVAIIAKDMYQPRVAKACIMNLHWTYFLCKLHKGESSSVYKSQCP